MHPMLNTAVSAARLAGNVINRAALDLERVRISEKQRNDFVTEVDQEAERVIKEALLKAYPNHSILGEESGHTSRRANETLTSADNIWVIDPLDGTTNFIHGMPQYAVSIALLEKGVATQAVVYDPASNEMFTATRGRGAYLDDRRIRVSKRETLAESLVGTGFPYRKIDQLDEYLRMFRAAIVATAGVRRPGAAALDLAYVASGRYDAFFEFGLSPWDVAAGGLLVREAGGLIGDFSGDSNWLEGQEIVAATPKVFAALLKLLSAARRG
ncbi:MAG: inositol monophosphatase family protein [Burkholderiaceae bacterium]